MTTSKTPLIITAVGLLLHSYGCATWRKYSEPSVEAVNGWELELNGGNGVLKNNEVELYVDPVNDGPSHGITILPIPGIPMGSWVEAKKGWKVFEVRIMVRTYVHGYKFNPSKVYLNVSDGKEAVPYMYSFSPDAGLCFYGDPNNLNENMKYIPIEDKYFMIPLYPSKIEVYDGCFSVIFSRTPPATSEVFSLKIDGLSRENNVVSIPKYYFKEATRGSGW